MLQTMQEKEEMEDVADLGVAAYDGGSHKIPVIGSIPKIPKIPNTVGIESTVRHIHCNH